MSKSSRRKRKFKARIIAQDQQRIENLANIQTPKITAEDVEFLKNVFCDLTPPTLEKLEKCEEEERRINWLSPEKMNIPYTI